MLLFCYQSWLLPFLHQQSESPEQVEPIELESGCFSFAIRAGTFLSSINRVKALNRLSLLSKSQDASLQGCGSGSGSVLDPYLIGSVDPDPDPESGSGSGSGSGSRRAKMTHKSRQ